MDGSAPFNNSKLAYIQANDFLYKSIQQKQNESQETGMAPNSKTYMYSNNNTTVIITNIIFSLAATSVVFYVFSRL